MWHWSALYCTHQYRNDKSKWQIAVINLFVIIHTSACFKIVNKCKISKFARFKFKHFSRSLENTNRKSGLRVDGYHRRASTTLGSARNRVLVRLRPSPTRLVPAFGPSSSCMARYNRGRGMTNRTDSARRRWVAAWTCDVSQVRARQCTYTCTRRQTARRPADRQTCQSQWRHCSIHYSLQQTRYDVRNIRQGKGKGTQFNDSRPIY